MTLEILAALSKEVNIDCVTLMYLYFSVNGIVHNIDPTLIKDNEYMISKEDNIINVKKVKELFTIYSSKKSIVIPIDVYKVESWIYQYRELFRDKTNIRRIGNKQNCIDNMRWFITKYPEFANIEVILEATKIGIKELNKLKIKGYGDVPCADNFICYWEKVGKALYNLNIRYENAISKHLYQYCEYVVFEKNKENKNEIDEDINELKFGQEML